MNLQRNVLLKNYCNYKIGGIAKYFVEIFSIGELKEAVSLVPNEKIFVLGGGTKVLIDDNGFDGLVILNKITGIERKGNNLRIGSGVLTKDLLEFCIENSLSGLEWAGGLPGTVGGAVRGNAGSFGKETKDSVIEVESFDLKTLKERTRNNEECQFGYRNSFFKSVENSEFITYVILSFKEGDRKEISDEIQQRIDYRDIHQPLEYPSVGSTFKNIPFDSLPENLRNEFKAFVKNDPFPVIPVTKLLALNGLKGRRVGGAMISDKQPNFIVNVDNAKASDVKALIEIAKKVIMEKYGIPLVEEVVYIN